MINYYLTFMPNVPSVSRPITSALKSEKGYLLDKWLSRSIEEVKQIFISSNVLAYFDPSKEIKLAVDASPTGIAAVISHVTKEGEKPMLMLQDS